MTDPNWLLSTIAQSGAALVAIIGGFLISRVVSLAARRDAQAHLRHDLATRLDVARTHHEGLRSERLAVSEDWFIDHCLDVLGHTGKLDADEVLEDFIPLGSDETEMGPVANRLVSAVARATQDVEGLAASLHGRIDIERLRRNGVAVADEDEPVYGAYLRWFDERPTPNLTPCCDSHPYRLYQLVIIRFDVRSVALNRSEWRPAK
jgi:hypothetical protein